MGILRRSNAAPPMSHKGSNADKVQCSKKIAIRWFHRRRKAQLSEILMPSTLAVFRLTTIKNFADHITGFPLKNLSSSSRWCDVLNSASTDRWR